MRALAKIHIAKKQLGLDDDTYRMLLVRVTGKSSSKAMNPAEQLRVVEEFQRLGFKAASKDPRKAGKAPSSRLSGPYAAKLQALWIAGWNLGLVRDRRDSALTAFVERQTGMASTAWLRNAGDAAKAVEALKGWLARDGGVRWSVGATTPDHARRYGYQIAVAQFTKLNGSWNPTVFWQAVHQALGRHGFSEKPTDAEWIVVMNVFGERIRALPAKSEAA